MAEQVKPLVLQFKKEKKEYTLEFNRDTIRFAEARGFVPDDVDKYPMTKIYEFFWLAFRMHHPSFSLNQAEKMLDKMGGMSDALGKRLGELWAVPYETLNQNNGDEKNGSVTVEL